MSAERLRELAISPIVAVYNRAGEKFMADLRARLPEGGMEHSIVPYLALTVELCAAEGLDGDFMGGLGKQALRDPASVVDPEAGQVHVANDASCLTLQKATLFRPEGTPRDIDFFAYRLRLKNGLWAPTGPEHDEELKRRSRAIQTTLHEAARERGMPRGPEFSLFGYEEIPKKFRFTQYATFTEYTPGTGEELMGYPLVSSRRFPTPKRWQTIVVTPDTVLELPSSSPVRSLGRTMNRTLVTRVRDDEDVKAAVRKIRADGLYDEILGDEGYEEHRDFRNDLDMSLIEYSLSDFVERKGVIAAIHLAIARKFAPHAAAIEESWVAVAIRDPEHPIGKIAAKLMNART